MAFIWPGPPGAQPVGDLRVAQLALLVAGNGLIVSPSYLSSCPCDDGGRCFFQDGVAEQRCFDLANLVTAVLGLALLVGDMAFSTAVPGRSTQSQALATVARWLVGLAKVATVGTFQHWINSFYLCLKTWSITSYIIHPSLHDNPVLVFA
ncbi:uncharacterized protein LOC127783005 [Oryza glaberrima]|uniref:PGG domain-containing protein n=1 Tax=Oryza glaberrima TaxID=4538 RepID=I1QJ90_ORYGL|nr:uncharacterized protein LOC127783005 [Oryza glaberrima]